MTKITLFDGGVGQEIFLQSKQPAHPMWSIHTMLEQPKIVQQVHQSYIDAGCNVLTLNTYTATPTRVARTLRNNPQETLSLAAIYAAAIQSAKECTQAAPHVQIAGCLPPLVASYHTDVCLNYEESLVEYQEIVRLQQDVVDFFLCETMANIAETRAAAKAASDSAKPMIVSFSLQEGKSLCLRSGEPLHEAIEAIMPFNPCGIMLNCNSPETITYAMPTLAKLVNNGKDNIRFGAYANGFTSVDSLKPGGTVDSLSGRKDLSPQDYVNFIEEWIAEGASLLGGCCEISPVHMQEVYQRLINEKGLSLGAV